MTNKENVTHGRIRMANGSSRSAVSVNGVVRFAPDQNATNGIRAHSRPATEKQAATFIADERTDRGGDVS